MLDDFLIRAMLAGLGVALAAAPLGCFVVWRRMAYFGDATAHASILGIAIALSLDLSVFGGTLFVALLMALIVSTLSGRGYATDTLLGVMAHSALAIGLVAASFLSGVQIDLMAYLFGDILVVTRDTLVLIWGGAALVLGLLIWRWQALLMATLNADLAQASGINPKREELILTVTLALVVAIAIKVVGVLLIVALLLIPAAAARPFANSPERMALCAAIIGGVSSTTGLWVSYLYDTPTGPTIVCCAAAIFVLSGLARLRA